MTHVVAHLLFIFSILVGFSHCFKVITSHKHRGEAVQQLTVNETVGSSSSSLVFSWEKCLFCDGYQIRLYLEKQPPIRELTPFLLKSAVTSLTIPNVPFRTNYKFEIRRSSDDFASSEVTGRTFTHNAPNAVDKLSAQALTNTSIRIEWNSLHADGFVAKIFKESVLVHEKLISDFSNHSELDVTNLQPNTEYDVVIRAFYLPLAAITTSPAKSLTVKTLPTDLPKLKPILEFTPDANVTWSNPNLPSPVAHDLVFSSSSKPDITITLGGSTNWLVLPVTVIDKNYQMCRLITYFSVEKNSSVVSDCQLLSKEKSRTSFTDDVACRDGYRGSFSFDVKSEKIRVNHEEWHRVNFSALIQRSYGYGIGTNPGLYYKICSNLKTCESPSWSRASDVVEIRTTDIRPWIPINVNFYAESGSCKSEVQTVTLPALAGTVEPVKSLVAAASNVSWEYDQDFGSADYFLLTYCSTGICSSLTVTGEDRSIRLNDLLKNQTYHIIMQAVKTQDDTAFVSRTEMTLLSSSAPDHVSVTAEEVPDSSMVRLNIHHNSSVFPTVGYHISVCNKPLLVWNDFNIVNYIKKNHSCETFDSSNSTVDVVRKAWTLYEVSVKICYGDSESEPSANVTLPIYKQAPEPLINLTWDRDSSFLSWEYRDLSISGFTIAICSSLEASSDSCRNIQAGVLDRGYHISLNDMQSNETVVSVSPNVFYDGVVYEKPGLKISLARPCQTSPTGGADDCVPTK